MTIKSLLAVGLVFSVTLLYSQEKVSVAAAANVSSVATPLAEAFARSHPEYRAQFTFGASGALVTQILNGAPFQLYLSADMSFPQKLVDAGETDGQVRAYATGTLILLSTKKLDLAKGLAVLAEPTVVQIAYCNPLTAPYGKAAEDALSKAGLLDRVRSKLVMGQTVTQALQFTLTSTDAGFVNKSSLYTKDVSPYNREGVYWIEVDPTLYSPITQGFVLLKSARTSPGALAFASFLTSPEARAIFSSFGYGTP